MIRTPCERRGRGAASALSLLLLAGCVDTSSTCAGLDTASADTLSLAERQAIGARITFTPERDGYPAVYLIDSAHSAAHRLGAMPVPESTAAAAPDGSALVTLAVPQESPKHREELRRAAVDGGSARRIGPAGERARNPSWSPDGRWVVLESDSASFADLYRITSDGRGLARLTNNAQGNFDPQVSPVGQWIAFVSSRDDNAEVYRMRADGSAPQRLTAFHLDDVHPRWSPDGQRIAFVSNREGADRIWLMAADGTYQRRLNPEGDSVAVREEADPVWSPDGRRIAYLVREGGQEVLWTTEVETGSRTRIADSAQDPAWSTNGRFLAWISDREGGPELYLTRADGRGRVRLTHSTGANWLPRWVSRSGRNGR